MRWQKNEPKGLIPDRPNPRKGKTGDLDISRENTYNTMASVTLFSYNLKGSKRENNTRAHNNQNKYKIKQSQCNDAKRLLIRHFASFNTR